LNQIDDECIGNSQVAYFIFGGESFLMKQHEEAKLEFSITHWFQPIYHLKDSHIIGYEALMRDASQYSVSPVEIFRAADKKGLQNVLDRISIKTALEAYKDDENPLFLNIFPSTLMEKGFLAWWDTYGGERKNVVLELLENEPIRDWEELKSVTRQLQDRGVRIAVDDMGGGYSFFQQWIELCPDFIKLDRYFSENLSMSSRKQKTVSSLVDLLSETTDIIIEGIEKEEDLDIAKSLGIDYAQGFLLGRPSPLKELL